MAFFKCSIIIFGLWPDSLAFAFIYYWTLNLLTHRVVRFVTPPHTRVCRLKEDVAQLTEQIKGKEEAE